MLQRQELKKAFRDVCAPNLSTGNYTPDWTARTLQRAVNASVGVEFLKYDKSTKFIDLPGPDQK